MATLERGRSKHNDLVAQLNRATLKRDKAIEALVRAESKRNSLIRAVARSQKRLAKAAVVAQVNAPMVDIFNEPEVTLSGEDLTIPSFLQR